MSRPGGPRPGDLDAILRDDLALDSIAHGRRPRGADSALDLLSALGEDVEMRVPRRRHVRSRRFSRGLIVTTMAATMVGATGVAAAEPGDSSWGAFQLWSSQEDSPGHFGPHTRAANASLSAAEHSLGQGDAQGAATSLRAADVELGKASSGMQTRRLRQHASNLHTQLYGPRPHQADGPGSLHPVPTQPMPHAPSTAQAGNRPTLWNWLWGIPPGGPDWQPPKHQSGDSQCSARSCDNSEPPATDTPGTTAPNPEPTHGQDHPSLLRRLFGTPHTASPSSDDSPSSSPSNGEPTTPSVPSTPTASPSESPSSSTDSPQPSPSSGSSGSGHSGSQSGSSPTPRD